MSIKQFSAILLVIISVMSGSIIHAEGELDHHRGLVEHAKHSEHDDEGHQETSDHDEHGHDDEGHVEMSVERSARAGIETRSAGAVSLTDSLRLFGRTEPDPQQVSHVRARYPGLIRRIVPALGEMVEKSAVIAMVEANESLQRYSIRAPITGIVVQRHANSGEYADEEPLLTIADYSRLWVALSVFPQDAEKVRAGQTVRLSAGERSALSTISFINPGTGERPSIMARLPLDNRDGQWSPGLLVEADVIVSELEVPLGIDNRALQRVEDQDVVFVQTDDGFEVTPVQLGRRDEQHSEVLSGLKPGQRYAVENSYLLKAELEKSGASHEH